MMISRKQLMRLDVVTQSGQHVGRVVDLDIDVDTHAICRYHIADSTPMLPGIPLRTLSVAPVQVISIDEHQMVIEDAFVKDDVTAESAV
ncbi:MAG: hypothetical protein WC289_01520 [Patescibacteria group bacterium]|jgi:sporulation protein YlmC with PRC-barrel domain